MFVETRFIFSPVVKLWFSNVIIFAPVEIPDVGHETESTSILSFKISLLTTTSDNVPTPTDVFEITLILIKSPSFNWWELEPKETVFFIFLTLTFSWLKLVSNEYVSLSSTAEPLICSWKNNSGKGDPFTSVPTPDFKAIIFLFFLTAKTVDGIEVIEALGVVDTPTGFPPLLTVNFWFVTNGWFSRYIPFVGIVLVILVSPNENSVDFDRPAVVPNPTDLTGLKNTFWFTFESKLSTDFLIVNESGTM